MLADAERAEVDLRKYRRIRDTDGLRKKCLPRLLLTFLLTNAFEESQVANSSIIELGGIMPVRCIIARSPNAAIAILHVVVFVGEGIELEIGAWRRASSEPASDVCLSTNWWPKETLQSLDEDPPGLVQLEFEYSDGTVLNNRTSHRRESPSRPSVGIEFGAGIASSHEGRQGFFLWPLPPAGDVVIRASWPSEALIAQEFRLDGDLLRSTALAGERVFD